MKKLLLLSVSLPSLVIADLAIAQDGQQDDETITVVGSRVKGRTALDSNVPVDVIQAGELANTPSLNMKDAMQSVSPSFVVERDAISDGDSLVRNSSLRGLHQGEVVTLLNNKRVHRSAIITYAGYQAADIGTFTVNSIKSMEILRDGAAAQYGADAVAGVINLTLDDSEGISAQAGYSKFYKGDGTAYNVASKVGLNLADRGFLTITAAYGKQNHTDRATEHLIARDHVNQYAAQESFISTYRADNPGATRDEALGDSGGWFDEVGGEYEFNNPEELNPDTIAPFGIPQESYFNVTWNAAMEVGENSEIYAFGNFSKRHMKQPFNYRAGVPHGYSSTLANGKTGGNSGASRQLTYGYNDVQYLYGTVAANSVEHLLTTDRDGNDNEDSLGRSLAFSGLGIHPNGFNPWFELDSKDLGAYAGIRGEFDNGLTYDLSGSIGRNRVDNYLSDTLNASQGAPAVDPTDITQGINYDGAQTSFYIGAQVNIERSIGLDFTYEIETDAVEALNVAFGAEYRSDQYYIIPGETNSWSPGFIGGPDLAAFAAANPGLGLEGGRGVNSGSDGFGGFSPSNAFDASRHNYALYVDVDTQVTEDLNVAVAARYEDFSDFGDNFSWKIASRYQLVEDLLAVRAAASTGFHAPSVGQINNQQVRTGFKPDGSQVQSATLPANETNAAIFGISPLGPEIANNLSAGVILTPGDNTNITIDLFQIKLRDRIEGSQDYDLEAFPNEFAALAASGFEGADKLNEVDFLTNGTSTKTKGIEVVATHNIDFDNSSLKMTASWAHVSTRVTEFNPATTSVTGRFNDEHNTAPHKATFTANYSFDDINIMGRARWWSTRKRISDLNEAGVDIGSNADLGDYRLDENPGRVFFDLAVTYDVSEQFQLTVGANNIFNKYPLAQPTVVEFSQRRGRQYLEGPGWQGGSYYAKVKANF